VAVEPAVAKIRKEAAVKEKVAVVAKEKVDIKTLLIKFGPFYKSLGNFNGFVFLFSLTIKNVVRSLLFYKNAFLHYFSNTGLSIFDFFFFV